MASSVVVARSKSDGLEYLTEGAASEWTDARSSARHFLNMRDATRAALRLPSRFRAFALPLHEAN